MISSEKKDTRRHRKKKETPFLQRKINPSIAIGLIGLMTALSTTFLIAQNIAHDNAVTNAERTRAKNSQGTATQQGGILDLGPGVTDDYLNRIAKVWFLNPSEGQNIEDFEIGYCTALIQSAKIISDSNYEGNLVETETLTAKHCIEKDDTTVTVLARDGEIYAATVTNIEQIGNTLDEDYAVIVTTRSREETWDSAKQFSNVTPSLPLNGSPDLSQGDSITICGYPYAVQDSISIGTLYCFHTFFQRLDNEFISVYPSELTGGISGAPGITEDGNVVGVVIGTDDVEVNGYGYLLPILP